MRYIIDKHRMTSRNAVSIFVVQQNAIMNYSQTTNCH